jgi:copper(I)-binding protein
VIKVWTVALAAACFSLTAIASQETALEFSNAWVRSLPPSQSNTAGYLTLVNRGETAVAVVGASSDLAKKVELHTTRQVDGLMRMERLEGLAVAPGETVELAPGGTHLMLLGLAYMPVPGDEVRLCLQLASGEEVCTNAEVRGGGKAPDAQDHQQHHQENE